MIHLAIIITVIGVPAWGWSLWTAYTVGERMGRVLERHEQDATAHLPSFLSSDRE